MIYFGMFLLTFVCFMTKGENAWWRAWQAYFLVLIFWMAKFVGRKTSTIVMAAWIWFLFLSVNIFADQVANKSLAPNIVLSLDKLAATYAFGFLLTTIFLLIVKRTTLSFIGDAFAILCIADSLFVILQYILKIPTGGFLINESMNGCFIAMTYPILNMKPEDIDYHLKPVKLSWEILFDVLSQVAPIVALFMANASIPIIAMALVWFLHYLAYGYQIRGLDSFAKKLSVAVSFAGVFFVIGFWKIPGFAENSGRKVMWEGFLRWFQEHGSHIFGMGPGSFFLFGPHIQTELHLGEQNWWVWAHNDFLQILIETGLVGLLLTILVVAEASFKAFKGRGNRYLGISLLTYCFVALFNWPLHNPLTAMFGCYLLASIYAESDGSPGDLQY